jgi:tRNA threonylcarbamoyladenosine biosynthesis protein TsaB
MIYILHIDTSGNEGRVVLAADGVPVATETNTNARDHAAAVNGMTERVLATGGIGLNDIDAFSVCAGPGSYTGLRIGVATAKGFCYALDKPLLLQNKLTLLAWQAFHRLKDDNNTVNKRIISILTAREKEYFTAIYDDNFNTVLAPVHIAEIELLEEINKNGENAYVTGKIEAEVLQNNIYPVYYHEDEYINAGTWAQYALMSYQRHEFANLSTSEPFYLKQVFINK